MPKGKIKNKTQLEKKMQTTEPDSDMPGMLELLGKEFKITMINMLMSLMEKGNNIQEEISYINIEMETLRIKRKC